MTLEEFEKSLAEKRDSHDRSHKHRHRSREHKHRHRHHDQRINERSEHKHKRRRLSDEKIDDALRKLRDPSPRRAQKASAEYSSKRQNPSSQVFGETNSHQDSAVASLKRDSWMEGPSSLEFEYLENRNSRSKATQGNPAPPPAPLKKHDNELNLAAFENALDTASKVKPELKGTDVDYTFGDSGSSWRMTRLNGVYRKAKESCRQVEEVAIEQYGDLRFFDHAREEEIELDRREIYGRDYSGKTKPDGEVFAQRELKLDERSQTSTRNISHKHTSDQLPEVTQTLAQSGATADPTMLNKLKAQIMKAKLRGSSELPQLEAQYKSASELSQNFGQTVVLNHMENRMLAGSRRGEAKAVDTKRGNERGLVEENEDMSIEDMIREERRTKTQAGGEGRRFAERIAKDSKFDNDLEYMDENAAKLAKRVHNSEINLRNIAISDLKKVNRALDECPLCHHEDTRQPPTAPIVSLATRTYLTLPTEPELSEGGATIVPVQHRSNLLECDDDEWEEIRNFMKSLTRMYHDQGRDVIFYENAAAPHRRRHAALEVVPLPYSLGDTAPAFFKEALLTADEEWSQHKKIIDTLAKAKQGFGKSAFRRSLAKEMPYFHVWFTLDGGLGHIVENSQRWPKGDQFAREIIGGMLDKDPQLIKKNGRWVRGIDARVEGFRARWRKFDWTRVLMNA